MQKIKKFRDLLIKEKDELKMLSLKTKDSRAPVILDQQSVGRLSRMDAIQQQNMNLATETNRNNKVSQIENTLKRIELEKHGIECAMLPMRHSRTLGGTFHCVTCDLERK